jgi:TDG/mug DNA glycosylase family protein
VKVSVPDPAGLPLRLAELHHRLDVGERVDVEISSPDLDSRMTESLATGAGFEVIEARRNNATSVDAVLERQRTLPDTVGPDMKLLICGLNPSPDAADAGVGFAGRSNRFWPAALGAGLVAVDRDPLAALVDDGVGMTDLVKRTTRAANELKASEYRDGVVRVETMVRWLKPGAICFVGLAGWRAAVDKRSTVGTQSVSLGGRPVYVMSSTSGLNARVLVDEHAHHLRAAFELGSTAP